MKIAIVSASHRKNSRSLEVAQWVSSALRSEGGGLEPVLFDLSQIEMPFWSEELWDPKSLSSRNWQPYREQLLSCSGVVLISPEWAGMIPPKLTNFLLSCSSQELAYKPSLLVGVSSGISGTYPVAQLRMSGSKNNQMVYLPDHLIVRHVGTEGALERLEPRLKFNLKILKKMAECLAQVREKIDLSAYPYGQ
ncbi:NAD(P)H-dependent oxidoreductase [bacterium]|nr:NAD(P)H-dependent oxidoreductase [bacterium]